MLVVSRKTGQTIVIGTGEDAIRIQVVAVGHGKVLLGTDAPNGVQIVRSELLGDAESKGETPAEE